MKSIFMEKTRTDAQHFHLGVLEAFNRLVWGTYDRLILIKAGV